MFNFFEKKSKTKGQEKIFTISGMHCVSCGLNIDGELEELAGVEESLTNYAKSQTRVIFDDQKISEKKLKQAIEKIGYSVIKIEG